MSFCIKNNCMHCCIEADVPLLQEDINRLIMTGYYDVYFAEENNGAMFIRKVDGKCIFFKNGQCEVWDLRPKRCRCPQLTYDDKTESVVVLNECKFKDKYRMKPADLEFMENFIKQLIKEIEKRINYNPQRASLGKAETKIVTID